MSPEVFEEVKEMSIKDKQTCEIILKGLKTLEDVGADPRKSLTTIKEQVTKVYMDLVMKELVK